jgi:hypothetical protein
MRVATSGDPTIAMWAATRYDPASALRTAWAKLFRVMAWCAAVPSFGLLAWSAIAYARIDSPTQVQTLWFFVNDFLGACGIGLTALFASVPLPILRRRDVPVLFGGCFAAVLFLYLPSLLHTWPVLREKRLPVSLVTSLAFPFALVAIAAAAAFFARRRKKAVA